MKKRNLIYLALTLVMVLGLAVMPASAQEEPEEPAPNPTLVDACGLDIAMLLDMTGSISSSGEVDTVKNAAKNFIDAFLPDTPTLIGLVEFSDGTAAEVQDLTADAADLKSDIDGLSASGATNWMAAIDLGRAMLEGGLDRDDADHPDLILIITDGNPNEPGNDAEALAAAIEAANDAKTSSASLPIRIVGIGVGDVNVSNLVDISGPNVDDDPITKNTDVITTDFGELADVLGELAAALCEPQEEPEDCCESHDVIAIDNEAVVGNRIEARSSTGGNWAGGSYGGRGGEGGAILNGYGEVEEAMTGAGGNGASGGIGGAVMTGNATTEVDLGNAVNTNDTGIDRCVCQGETECSECCNTCGHAVVLLRNRALLGNDIMARAKTGYSDADGSYGGSGGGGGVIENGCGEVDDSSTGSGGHGGGGGEGGVVQTGAAWSRTNVMNVVNRNLTRIMR